VPSEQAPGRRRPTGEPRDVRGAQHHVPQGRGARRRPARTAALPARYWWRKQHEQRPASQPET
jgi:hypothetical protein